MKFMSINHTPAQHDNEERRSLLNATKNANATINVRLSTVAILVGCGFLLGSLSGPLSGSGNSIGKRLLETVALKDDLVERSEMCTSIVSVDAHQISCPFQLWTRSKPHLNHASFNHHQRQREVIISASSITQFNHVVVIQAPDQKDCNQSELRITSCQS